MKEKALTVEFRLRPTKTSLAPKPPAGFKAERQRQERAARRARNLALAYYIDGLFRSGEVADLAAVARMCGVSRARISKIMLWPGKRRLEQEGILNACPPIDSSTAR